MLVCMYLSITKVFQCEEGHCATEESTESVALPAPPEEASCSQSERQGYRAQFRLLESQFQSRSS